MENHSATIAPIQYPAIWNEEWLQIAIDELDKFNLSPDELLVYEMTLSVNALTVYKEEQKIREAEQRAAERREATGEARAEARAEAEAKARLEAAINYGLRAGLSVELIAEMNQVSVEFVRKMQQFGLSNL